MLRTLTDLKRCTLGALDGDIGTVEDAYFDDEGWTVRYLVVDTPPGSPAARCSSRPRPCRSPGMGQSGSW